MNIFNVLLTQPLANGLIIFYQILGQNLGLAIIGFSIFLRLALSPLTKPYMDSMKKMRSFQDDINKLKRRHKGDRQKLAQAQADFYKEKGINPTAGCLPYILQIVILISFFNLFRVVLVGNGEMVLKFNELLYEPLRFTADAVINTNFLWLDLTTPDVLNIEGIPFPVPGLLLILASVFQLLSAKITQPYIEGEKKAAEQTKEMGDDVQVAMQSSMVYTFPIITLLVGLNFPAGLALYWLVFSAYQAFSQYRASGWGGATPWVKKLASFAKSS